MSNILPTKSAAKRRNRNSELTDSVLVALRRIIRATDIRSREIAKQTGLTTAQLVVLRAIAKLGEVTTRSISDEVSLSPATVTTIMDRPSERGFVERYRSESDRRVVHTRLTRKGRSTLTRAPVLLHELFSDRFAELPAPEQRAIIDTLQRVARMMNASELDAAPLLIVD